jgi:hypothetical protein
MNSFSLELIFYTVPDASKNDVRFKGGHKWLENNHKSDQNPWHGFGQAKFAYDGSILCSSNLQYCPSCL